MDGVEMTHGTVRAAWRKRKGKGLEREIKVRGPVLAGAHKT